MNKIEKYENNTFDSIRKSDQNGNEYWEARELQKVLEYSQWRRFEDAINRARKACRNSKCNELEHFADVGKIVKTGALERKIANFHLSRYACYLIVQNGDPRKKVIALGQTYFAIQTRRQELSEKDYNELTEDEKRIYNRGLTKRENNSLNKTAKNSGVKNFDKFHNCGYRSLYNGETANDIAKRKGLRYREDILDNMGSEELAANLFRITQTDAKLKRENIKAEKVANKVHYETGKKVRKAIKNMGGTMPEKLPTPNKSIKELNKQKTLE
jgi:DNA-damage-inducible protein D